METGYDLPVYGIIEGTFTQMHVLAITSISISLVCVTLVMVLSFKENNKRPFYKWPKSERFVIYMVICDGMFNISHITEHILVLVSHDHVRPQALCKFYSTMSIIFVVGQTLLVNLVAVNCFVMIYFSKHMEFGKRDWRLVAWIFVLPFVITMALLAADQLGPTGA